MEITENQKKAIVLVAVIGALGLGGFSLSKFWEILFPPDPCIKAHTCQTP